MNCIKPSGPYIAFLALILTVSFITIPSGKNAGTNPSNELTNQAIGQEKLEQVDHISMLNTDRYE